MFKHQVFWSSWPICFCFICFLNFLLNSSELREDNYQERPWIVDDTVKKPCKMSNTGVSKCLILTCLEIYLLTLCILNKIPCFVLRRVHWDQIEPHLWKLYVRSLSWPLVIIFMWKDDPVATCPHLLCIYWEIILSLLFLSLHDNPCPAFKNIGLLSLLKI